MKVRIGVACLVVLFAAGSLVSCGGGGGGGGAPACTTCDNVAGTWRVTEVDSGTNNCSGSQTVNYTVTQSGCGITVSRSGVSRSGTICNKTLNWAGSYPEGAGTSTITTMSVTVSGTTTSTMSGSSNWVYSEPGFTCSGTTSINGTKL